MREVIRHSLGELAWMADSVEAMPQEIEPKGPAEECLRKRAIGELHGLTLTTGTDEAVE
jgi:hypothetical protein